MILRILAFFVGAGMLAAVTHATIMYNNAYGTPHGFILMALGVSIALGAVLIGSTWGQNRRVLTVLIAVALLAGEAYALGQTAERVIALREAAQMPAIEAQKAKAAAQKDVKSLKAKLDDLPTSSTRLELALVAKAQADKAVTEKAAERGCARNCRALLQAKVDVANAEVAAARQDLEASLRSQRAALEAKLATAQARLDSIVLPASGSPMASKLSVEPWVIDVTFAALLSLASNGIAALFLAFAGHAPRVAVAQATMSKDEKQASGPVVLDPVPGTQSPPKGRKPRQLPPPPKVKPKSRVRTNPTRAQLRHVATFLESVAEIDESATTPLAEFPVIYKCWCREVDEVPLDVQTLGEAFCELTAQVGARIQQDDKGERIVHGLRLAA